MRKNNTKLFSFALMLVLVFGFLSKSVQHHLTVLGATVNVTELHSGLVFKARVDTGASICSIHCDEIVITDESEIPRQNIGSQVRFLLEDKLGNSRWVKSKIADYSPIRSIDASTPRYHVRLNLSCLGSEYEVLLTLADRSHMKYRMLLGRNFLRHRFVVDVSKDNLDFH